MRPNSSPYLNSLDASVNETSIAFPIQQIFSISAQIITTGSSTGSLQLEVSNDIASDCTTDPNGNFIPVNWSNLGTAITISSAGVLSIGQTYVCNQFMRAVYTKNNGSAGTITVKVNTQAY